MRLLVLFLFISVSAYSQRIIITIDSNSTDRRIDTIYSVLSRIDTVIYMIHKVDTIHTQFSNTLNDYLTFIGKNQDNTDAYMTFKDNLPATPGNLRGRYLFRFDPLEANQGNGPFLMSQSTTKYGNWQPDEVFMMGWNLAYGGTAFIHGQPAIGYSMEQHFKPGGPGLGLTESHEYYIHPGGTQVRLKSYTINNATGYVDFYHTTNNFYLRQPANPDFIYLRAAANPNGTGAELNILGQDPIFRIGNSMFQHISGNGQLSLNSGLRLSKLKAPAGTKKYLVIDEHGDISIY